MEFSPEMALPNIMEHGSRNPTMSQFKQSNELVLAIDKLYIKTSDCLEEDSGNIPDRKLDFQEVRKILIDQSVPKQLNNGRNYL